MLSVFGLSLECHAVIICVPAQLQIRVCACEHPLSLRREHLIRAQLDQELPELRGTQPIALLKQAGSPGNIHPRDNARENMQITQTLPVDQYVRIGMGHVYRLRRNWNKTSNRFFIVTKRLAISWTGEVKRKRP